jgi:soluble lytic murein transglycosylase-like protein
VPGKLLFFIALSLPAFAGEYAVLSSGLRLRIERHESAGTSLRLYTSKDGFVDVAQESVAGFEADDYVAPPPAPAAPVAAAVAVPAAPRPDPKTMVRDAAARYALPKAFVESVAKVESAMKPDAVSPKGAIGVMQLMPSTAKALAADATDPEQNIDAGTHLLHDLLLKYDGDVAKALAAYNAGAGAVDKYQGVPPYRETQTYVDKVIRNYIQQQSSEKNR